MGKENRKSSLLPDFERLGWPSKQEVVFTPGQPFQIIPHLDPERGRQLFKSIGEEAWRDGDALDIVSIRNEDQSVVGDVIFWGLWVPQIDGLEYPSGKKVPILIFIDVYLHKFSLFRKMWPVFNMYYGSMEYAVIWHYFEPDEKLPEVLNTIDGWVKIIKGRKREPKQPVFYEEDLPQVRYEVQLPNTP